MCTTPEAIKSLMLKYIELLEVVREHTVSTAAQDAASITALQVSYGREADKAATALGKVLRLFGKDQHGVALLDEVDLLLNPVRMCDLGCRSFGYLVCTHTCTLTMLATPPSDS